MIHYYEAAHQYIHYGLNYEVIYLFRSLVASMVDTFIIISGFYMVKSYTRKPSKAITLILQVLIISELECFLDIISGVSPLSFKLIIGSLVSTNYYTTLFVVLFIISPYINKIMNEMNDKEMNRFILILIIIFSFYSIASKVFCEVIHKDWFGINPVGAWGSMQGFNIVNFSLLYIVGAFIRIKRINSLVSKKKSILCFISSTVIIILWSYCNRYFPKYGQISAWCYDNPIVILQGTALFLLFYQMNFYSKMINRLASAVYATFILHIHLLFTYAKVDLYCESSPYIMILHYLLFSIVCLLCGWAFYEIYNLMTKKVLTNLDNHHLIKYFSY